MKSSVVVAVYNGHKFIQKQLDSIKNQSRPADEVIIKDDSSTDDSFGMIYDYIRKNGLNWTVSKNETNIGYSKNFYHGTKEAKGDVVFFCDQDDIWDKDKIKYMMSAFENDQNIEVLFHGFIPYYENNNARKVSKAILKSMRNTGSVKRLRFTKHFFAILRPGCACAIRRSFVDNVDDMWYQGYYAHDFLIWAIGNLLGKAYVLDKNLIKWRRWGGNSSDPTKNIQQEGRIMMWYKDDISCQRNENKFFEELTDIIDHNHTFWIDEKKRKTVYANERVARKALGYLENLQIIRMIMLIICNTSYWCSKKRPIRQILVMMAVKIERTIPKFVYKKN